MVKIDKWVVISIVVILGVPFSGAIYSHTSAESNPASDGNSSTPNHGILDDLNNFIDNSTQSHGPDTDRDGLTDEREQEMGTSPTNPDTDGDRLLDGWEVRNRTSSGAEIPDSDPLHKDLYIHVFYSSDVKKLTSSEKQQLQEIWASMPIRNPDGDTGIRTHIRDSGPYAGLIGGSLTISSTNTVIDSLSEPSLRSPESYYTIGFMGNRTCVAHQVIYARTWNATLGGFGDAPGYQSFVDGTVYPAKPVPSIRVQYTTHELLHNIVGRFPDGSIHTDNGWLSHGTSGQFLSTAAKNELNKGFEEVQCS